LFSLSTSSNRIAYGDEENKLEADKIKYKL